MPNPLESRSDYEHYVYTILDRYAHIATSTLRIIPRGEEVAELQGEITSNGGLTVRVREIIDFHRKRILTYSYELRRGSEILTWFDPQPHPNEPDLATTFPHHQHIPPDIKSHRIPATAMAFDRPNLDALIDLLNSWP